MPAEPPEGRKVKSGPAPARYQEVEADDPAGLLRWPTCSPSRLLGHLKMQIADVAAMSPT
jgi:hypothetical protein